MLQSKKLVISVIIFILVLSLISIWNIGEIRNKKAIESKKTNLTDTIVETQFSSIDYDGDSINNSNDRCPRRPETKNGFQDNDGCPDISTTTTTGAS